MSAAEMMSWVCRVVCWLVLAGGVVLIPVGLRALVLLAFSDGGPADE